MRLQARRRMTALLGVLAVSLAVVLPATGAPSDPAVQIADAEEVEPGDQGGAGKLEPRYSPREPEQKPWYNSSYIFGMTRGVTGSTMHPAVKVPLLVLTVPLDFVFLPFAAIGGLFG